MRMSWPWRRRKKSADAIIFFEDEQWKGLCSIHGIFASADNSDNGHNEVLWEWVRHCDRLHDGPARIPPGMWKPCGH